jgi:hypothetical protein
MKKIFFIGLVCCFGLYPSHAQKAASISAIRFLGEYEIPYNLSIDSTQVGGLSGIDYDTKRNLFYAISDDRGLYGDIRFYSLTIDIRSDGIRQVKFVRTIKLLTTGNRRFTRRDQGSIPDAEGIRLNPMRDMIFWISEGERSVSSSREVLIDPFIRVADLNGKHRTTLATPENTTMKKEQKGPRRNSAFEGITFDETFSNVFVAMEEPLFEDGPRADTVENGATSRIYKFDVRTGKSTAQFAYPLEKVAFPPSPKNKFRINGISEILHAGNDELITVERSFSTGRLPCTVKVFLTDISTATDISDVPSLKDTSAIQTVRKKLLYNLDDLGIYIDNVEGVSFGPILPNGNRTLIFITDNNFNWFEKTQLLLFEIVK